MQSFHRVGLDEFYTGIVFKLSRLLHLSEAPAHPFYELLRTLNSSHAVPHHDRAVRLKVILFVIFSGLFLSMIHKVHYTHNVF